MDNNLIKCSQLSVNCVSNDMLIPGSIGPDFLGFDFNVREEQTEEMKKFITATLEIFEVPLLGMYIADTIYLDENDVSTKEKIINAIQSDAEYLKGEAERNSYSHFEK